MRVGVHPLQKWGTGLLSRWGQHGTGQKHPESERPERLKKCFGKEALGLSRPRKVLDLHGPGRHQNVADTIATYPSEAGSMADM